TTLASPSGTARATEGTPIRRHPGQARDRRGAKRLSRERSRRDVPHGMTRRIGRRPPIRASVTVADVSPAAPRITLLSRPGCHLCDDAREVVRRVAEDLDVTWVERDITQSAEDMREYWETIPVTLVDGVQHDFWRVSEDRLRAALGAAKE